jgi:putative phosphonate metabolism protein
MAPRYAVYYAPERESFLEKFGRSWLGYDAYTGDPVLQKEIPNLSMKRFSAVTSSPRRYGFHGTLKPPFRLAGGHASVDLFNAVQRFASTRPSFILPPFKPAFLDGFIALVPEEPCAELDGLAAECVQTFDVFRALPTAEELERRRSASLTESQENHLKKWGYPYVMSDFRFHLSLTGHLIDSSEKEILLAAATKRFQPFESERVVVDTISIFRQNSDEDPFRIVRTFPLSG